MKIYLMSSTHLLLSYPTPLTQHGIVILKTYVYILYIFEFMQGKNWKNLRSTWAQIDRVQNNVQHCVQIALLGKGGRDRMRTRAETPFQQRLKCKSPLWMWISTIYEYLLIFFLSDSLRSPSFSLSPCLPIRGLFETAKLLPQVRISFPKMFLLLFYMLNASLLYNFLMTVLLAVFVGVEQKKNTFLCMQPTNGGRETAREKEREGYKNITELWAIFHRI